MLQVLVSIYFIYVFIEKEFHLIKFIPFIRSIKWTKLDYKKQKDNKITGEKAI